MNISQTYTATGVNGTVSFQPIGGTSPFLYSVIPGGAGGSIDSNGVYQAPASLKEDVTQSYDVIQVTDNLGAKAFARILVTSVLGLVCDIIQHELGLENGRTFLWDQKIFQPTDAGLYVILSEVSCKPFANISIMSGDGGNLYNTQAVNMFSLLDVNIISRGPAARDRKEEVLFALRSVYSEQQQEANSFSISRLPVGSHFVNLSQVDGAAIPYRYTISFGVQYLKTKTVPVSYFDQFSDELVTNP